MNRELDHLLPRLFLALCMLLVAFHLSGCSSESDSKELKKDNIIVRKTEKSGVSMLIEVSPSRPRLADLVSMTVTISYPDSVRVEPPEFGHSVGDFTVRDYSQDLFSSDNEKSNLPESVISIRYQLEPMWSGRNLIRSIPVAFSIKPRATNPNEKAGDVTRDVLQSEPIEIFVESEFDAQTPDLSQISPMIEPMAIPSSRLIWLWAILLAGLLFAALGFWWFTKIKKDSLAEPPVSPEELAESALNQLIAEQLPSKGLVKEFYLRLTGIVRNYIEDKTGLRAPEQTTEEFLRDMRASRYFNLAQSSQLQEFLTAADLVKYAGQQPNQSNIEHSVQRAREFIAHQFTKTEDSNARTGALPDRKSPTRVQNETDQLSRVES